ncbi:jg20695 [Pararge aegeria aegeria]|uniref:Jg20695 protein n=1 Tax=Pararge aegeria aegeria TaxID=348720 RepID=A0A8S4RTM7_9NEOP|nr:jg20695 [Pararge aegeria aegeria]
MYLQSRNDHMPEKKPTSQPLPLSNHPIRNFNSNPIVPFFKPMNLNMPSPSRPQYMHQAPPQFNQFRLPISQPRGPTRTQHMFSAPLPGNNQRSAVFKLPPKPHGSTAMSGVSHFANKPLPHSGWNWAKQGNPPPSNYFKARDVNLNECSNYVDYYKYPDHYDYYYDPNDGIDYSDQYYDCYPYEFDTSHDMINNCNAQTTREPQQPEAETNEDFREESKSNRNLNLYEEIIPAQSSKLLRLPINAPDGEVLVEEQIVCNCIIGECLATVKNCRGIVEVVNPTKNDIIFSLHCATQATVFNVEYASTEHLSPRASEVLSRLRMNHLNEEEKANLKALCSKYSDVFYIEGEALTFTNKIKHSIRTTDEIPIHTKSYRYPLSVARKFEIRLVTC